MQSLWSLRTLQHTTEGKIGLDSGKTALNSTKKN
jgi:hypothetical protein